MEKNILFHGLCTALATPMKEGKPDYSTLEKLIAFQMEQKADAVLLLGTTGEASTLTRSERKEIAKLGGEIMRNRVKFILGCGANATSQTLDYAEDAVAYGADGILLVTPYYNKGTEEGIISHFLAVAEAVPLPQILYHVPSRTGVHFTLHQIEVLSRHKRIVGLKEACPDLDWLMDEMTLTKNSLSYYAGNDSLTIPTLSMGGIGVISVISNIFPLEMGQIVYNYLRGNREQALQMHNKLLPMMRLLFRETNPAPVKYALSLMGFGTGEMRLPMAEISPKLKEQIEKEMDLLKQGKNL